MLFYYNMNYVKQKFKFMEWYLTLIFLVLLSVGMVSISITFEVWGFSIKRSSYIRRKTELNLRFYDEDLKSKTVHKKLRRTAFWFPLGVVCFYALARLFSHVYSDDALLFILAVLVIVVVLLLMFGSFLNGILRCKSLVEGF